MRPDETHDQRRQRVLVDQVHNPPWALTLFLFCAAMLLIVLVAWTIPQPATAATGDAPVPAVQSDELRAQREATPPQMELLCFPKPVTVMCAQTPNGKFCIPAD